MSGEKTGSKAVLDAVSPETRAAILENLETLGVIRAAHVEPSMIGLLEAIYQKSRSHRRALEASPLCGCFHCLRIFPPSEIREWARSDASDTEKTCAVCPHCSVDAVLSSIDVELTPALLETLQGHWFAVARVAPDDP